MQAILKDHSRRRVSMWATVLVCCLSRWVYYIHWPPPPGNIVGPLLFEEKQAPYYTTGWITVVVTSIAAAALILSYRFFCSWENKRRDKSGTNEGFEHANDDDLTDKTVCGSKLLTLHTKLTFPSRILSLDTSYKKNFMLGSVWKSSSVIPNPTCG